MATKTANLNMRIEDWKKADAEQLYQEAWHDASPGDQYFYFPVAPCRRAAV